MLNDWRILITKGQPDFYQDGNVLAIDCKSGERGMWYASAEIGAEQELELVGEWSNGVIKIVAWSGEEALPPILVNHSGQLFPVAEGVNKIEIRCIRSGEGRAEFIGIALNNVTKPTEPGLPIPEPDTTPRLHVTGWKWGSNIMLTIHHELGESTTPPEDGAYQIKGWQTGKRLDLNIGELYVPPD